MAQEMDPSIDVTHVADHLLARGGGVDIVTRQAGSLATEEMTLNIGPQHPSTHGVLRLVLTIDGERIEAVEPVIGYMHRSMEKMSEVRDARQILMLTNRHDWLSAFNNEQGWIMAVEQLAGIEVPERAQWIRTMFLELNRILNHLMFMGSYPLELGAMTPMFYAFREREAVQALMESATGARLHHSYVRVGGLKEDLPRGFLDQAVELVPYIRSKVREFENLVLGNPIIGARTKGIGVLPADVAKDHGCSGPVIQGSGVALDPRRTAPYEKYDEVEFDVPIGENGDCYDRLWVLAQRVLQSCRIIEQCIARIPPGPVTTPKLPKTLKIPEGEIYVESENPLGIMGYYVVGSGDKVPYRVKMRTPSFSNVSVLPALLRGTLLPDLIAILGSIFFVVGDIDR